MHNITLSNDFHGTKIVVRSDHDSPSETWYHIQSAVYCGYPTTAERAKYNRIHRTLCGSHDCVCGTVR